MYILPSDWSNEENRPMNALHDRQDPPAKRANGKNRKERKQEEVTLTAANE